MLSSISKQEWVKKHMNIMCGEVKYSMTWWGKPKRSPFKRVKTYFVAEAGQDTGGLTRELWCLFARHVQQSLCEGKEHCMVLRHDANKLQVITKAIKSNPLSINILWSIGRCLQESGSFDGNLHGSGGLWLSIFCAINIPVHLWSWSMLHFSRERWNCFRRSGRNPSKGTFKNIIDWYY